MRRHDGPTSCTLAVSYEPSWRSNVMCAGRVTWAVMTVQRHAHYPYLWAAMTVQRHAQWPYRISRDHGPTSCTLVVSHEPSWRSNVMYAGRFIWAVMMATSSRICAALWPHSHAYPQHDGHVITHEGRITCAAWRLHRHARWPNYMCRMTATLSYNYSGRNYNRVSEP